MLKAAFSEHEKSVRGGTESESEKKNQRRILKPRRLCPQP
ncbi:hypothetical protein [Pantoea stewartii]|nr:hypothetical protein [Pantoea stewartii]